MTDSSAPDGFLALITIKAMSYSPDLGHRFSFLKDLLLEFYISDSEREFVKRELHESHARGSTSVL